MDSDASVRNTREKSVDTHIFRATAVQFKVAFQAQAEA